jgi:S1-C subfamily serine protease
MRCAMRSLTLLFLIVSCMSLAEAAEKPPAAEDAAKLPWIGMSFRWEETGDTETRVIHVAAVTEGGPAADAGIRPGDVIVTVAKRPVGFGDALEFLLFLSDYRPGDKLAFEIIREGARHESIVLVGELPESAREGRERSLRHARERRSAAARERSDE